MVADCEPAERGLDVRLAGRRRDVQHAVQVRAHGASPACRTTLRSMRRWVNGVARSQRAPSWRAAAYPKTPAEARATEAHLQSVRVGAVGELRLRNFCSKPRVE